MSKDGKYANTYVADTGYIFCCYICAKRFGGPVYGEREVLITRCDKCKNKRTNAEMLADGSNWIKEQRRNERLAGDAPHHEPVTS